MDINDLRSITTVMMLAFFVGIVWWAYSAKSKAAFEEAGRLPLDDEDDSHIVQREQRSAGHQDK
jgi:cytochrome c oxidase cbb3-type subunit 4